MNRKRIYFILTLFVQFVCLSAFAAKESYPGPISAQPAGGSVCRGGSISLSVTVGATVCGPNGSTTAINRTFTWYKTSTSCSGGSVVQTTTNTSSTDTYSPATTTAGTLYYYCVISWSAGSVCAPAGTLTSNCATVTVTNFNTKTWVSGAAWGSATWSPAGTPGACDSVIIGGTVTNTSATSIGSLTVVSGGNLTASSPITVNANGFFTINNGGAYTNNNSSAWSTTIFNGTESFGASSTITITSDDGNGNMTSSCSSNFGNVVYNINSGAFYTVESGFGMSRTIQGNLTIGSQAALICGNAMNGDQTFSVGGNFINQGQLRIKQASTGNLTISVGGNTTLSGLVFYGMYATSTANGNGNVTFTTTDLAVSAGTNYLSNTNASGTGNISMAATGNVTISGGSFYGSYLGLGNIACTISGTLSQSAGDFRGSYNTSAYGSGTSTYSIGAVNFTGGTFMTQYGCHTAGSPSAFNVTGNMNVAFGSTADIFRIIGLGKLSATYNNSPLTFTVGGNFSISGSAGEFGSNPGSGSETNTFTNVTISGGANYLNETIDAGNAHASTTNINGNLTVSGGTTYLSQNAGTMICNITGNVAISGGTLNTSTDATSNLNLTVGTASTTWSQPAGTVSLCNTNVKIGKTLTLINTQMGSVQASRTITVESDAKLYCDVYLVNGSGNFTLSSGAYIGIGNIGGITSSGATGNIRVTGTRTYNSNASYEYYLGQTPQVTGSFTTTITGGTYPVQVTNLIINKNNATDIVTLTNTTDMINNGTLTLTKGVLTTSYTAAAAPWIRIPNNSTSVSPAGGSANSYIDGYIRKTGNGAFIFPTGNLGYWRRIEITAPTASTEFEARYIHAAYSNTSAMAASPSTVLDHVSRIEHWYLSKPLGADFATTQVKLYWENAAASGIYKFDSLTVARWNGSAWEDANCYSSCPSDWLSSQPERTYSGSAAAFGAGTIRSNTVSSFSPFTLGSIGVYSENPLPVELTTFTVKLVQKTSVVKWTTASEINNNFFTVERSKNGIDFSSLMNVNSRAVNGNSTLPLYYDAKDNAPYAGVSYYRLKQTDFDGRYSYSNVVAINNIEEGTLSVYPNPVKDEVNVLVPEISLTGNARLEIYDVAGKQIRAQAENLSEGITELHFNTSDLSSGVYFISLKTDTQIFNQRIIKQ
jgi:hypothetical protein